MLPTNFEKRAKKLNIFIFGYEKTDFRGKKQNRRTRIYKIYTEKEI